MLVFVGLTNFSFGQTINLPADHGTLGTLNPPIVIEPGDGLNVWSIVNNSDCDLSIQLNFTIDGVIYSIQKNVLSGNVATFTSAELFTLTGSSSPSSITHSSMNIVQLSAPNTQIGVAYPNDDSRKSNSEITEGCDCVHVYWNEISRVIVISNC